MDSRRPADRASSDAHSSRAGRRPAWRTPPPPAPPPVTESPPWYARPLPWILGLTALNVALLLSVAIALWLPATGTPDTANESNRDVDKDLEVDLSASIATEFDLTRADPWPTYLIVPQSDPLAIHEPPPVVEVRPPTRIAEPERVPLTGDTVMHEGIGDGGTAGDRARFDRLNVIVNRAERRAGAAGMGASKESEEAVNLALQWLSEHQLADGSWSFDHRDGGQCQGRCKNHGSMKPAKNGATGLALMAFLGAGESHIDGKYQNTVAAGLRYLLSTLKDQGADGGSWYEPGTGTSYSHGIASIAMSEAYGLSQRDESASLPEKPLSDMTAEERRQWAEKRRREKEKNSARISIDKNRLKAAAQASLNYIMNAQHSAGGWRYVPKTQPGDTSHHGWMIMALKSGYMTDLKINPHTIVQANRFLDSVAKGDPHKHIFWYMPENEHGNSRATTAIGLLCRMYMGMERNSGTIARGVEDLGKWGPDLGGNMYYNYYATQVVFHFGDEPWKKWNKSLRDSLIHSQSKNDHEAGSWHFRGDPGSGTGGRLYCTAMAAMTLEVYYRYLPVYRNAADGDFDKADGDHRAKRPAGRNR
jgi:hypothetical protein